MIKLANITPGYNHSVLVSINALVDIDIGLLNLIKEEYLDPEIFNEDFLKNSSVLDFINMTYFRTVDNPLYLISHIDDKKLLDDYYIEFMQTKYNDIYDRSIYTDVLSLINMMIESNEANVTIFYYSDYAKEQLEKDIASGKLSNKLKIINAKELPRKVDDYNDIYVRSVFEFSHFKPEYFKSPKTFYISTFKRNFDELGRLNKLSSIEKLMTGKLMHEFFTFSLYNLNIVQEETKDNEGDSSNNDS